MKQKLLTIAVRKEFPSFLQKRITIFKSCEETFVNLMEFMLSSIPVIVGILKSFNDG